MALIVNLKWVQNLRGKDAERIATVSFRGLVQQSKVVKSAQNAVYFGENFEWPLARAAEESERLDIQIFNHNKYLANKLVGSYNIFVQQLISEGKLEVSDNLIDSHNRLLDVSYAHVP